MAFDVASFLEDIADSSTTVMNDFKEDPKTTLANYGLIITEEQGEALKAANQAVDLVPDLTTITAPIQPF